MAIKRFLILLVLNVVRSELSTDETAARQYAMEVNARAEVMNYNHNLAAWNHETNISDVNEQIMLDESVKLDLFKKEVAANASQYDWKNFNDADLNRLFSKLVDIGTAAMTDKVKLERLNKIIADMENLYFSGEVCLTEGNCLSDSDLSDIMATSTNYDALLKVWEGWRDATGPKIKKLYEEYVTLSNEAIVQNGYADTGVYWKSKFDTPTFEDDLKALFETLKPLYVNLHAYTRKKLKERYGAEKFPASGHIPAHLLGNMWAQSWENLYSLLEPYPGKDDIDVTPAMVQQKYTPEKMFELSDEFFQSLGMIKMPAEFWNYSMIKKPTDGREVYCLASAWDFYNKKDFRIQMCTGIKMVDLITVHEQMANIEYFLQYKDLHVNFRDGANPSFYEAVGGVVSLSAQTPNHLKKIGLLPEVTNDKEAEINYLMKVALQKIAFLPFGYLIDQWRWSVFRGETTPDKYNQKWWDLRCGLQGVSPPVERTEDDFDPGAKYHIPGDTPYIRYFVSFVIQFQFHKALCQAAGQTGPLNQCDIYQSTAAGQKLSDMMKLGSSKPWPEAMMMIAGEDKMNASALLEYFQPLTTWLAEQNGDDIGWEESCPQIGGQSSTSVSALSIVLLLFLSLMIYL